jgi:hypothetical protein
MNNRIAVLHEHSQPKFSSSAASMEKLKKYLFDLAAEPMMNSPPSLISFSFPQLASAQYLREYLYHP